MSNCLIGVCLKPEDLEQMLLFSNDLSCLAVHRASFKIVTFSIIFREQTDLFAQRIWSWIWLWVFVELEMNKPINPGQNANNAVHDSLQ